jgi:hypothetical protein
MHSCALWQRAPVPIWICPRRANIEIPQLCANLQQCSSGVQCHWADPIATRTHAAPRRNDIAAPKFLESTRGRPQQDFYVTYCRLSSCGRYEACVLAPELDLGHCLLRRVPACHENICPLKVRNRFKSVVCESYTPSRAPLVGPLRWHGTSIKPVAPAGRLSLDEHLHACRAHPVQFYERQAGLHLDGSPAQRLRRLETFITSLSALIAQLEVSCTGSTPFYFPC